MLELSDCPLIRLFHWLFLFFATSFGCLEISRADLLFKILDFLCVALAALAVRVNFLHVLKSIFLELSSLLLKLLHSSIETALLFHQVVECIFSDKVLKLLVHVGLDLICDLVDGIEEGVELVLTQFRPSRNQVRQFVLVLEFAQSIVVVLELSKI